MYGTEFRPIKGEFGLYTGQIRSGPEKIIHNGGWYNKNGEKLGWGDLDEKDFLRIALEIKEGEFFVILDERDSFWNFLIKKEAICDINAPGVEYIIQHARYIIGPTAMYLVDKFGWRIKEGQHQFIRGNLVFNVISRKETRILITGKP